MHAETDNPRVTSGRGGEMDDESDSSEPRDGQPEVSKLESSQPSKALLDAVKVLIGLATGNEVTKLPEARANEWIFTSLVSFTDGIGQGVLHADLFKHKGMWRIDITLKHNRVFATSDGDPTDREAYMNTVQSVFTVALNADALPTEKAMKLVERVKNAKQEPRQKDSKDSDSLGFMGTAPRITTAK